jgi:signal transduction histidine kinase
MRLRYRFLAALFAVMLLLSLITVAGFVLYRDTVVADNREELVQTGAAIATQVDDFATEKRRSVALWATNPAVGGHGSEAQERALASFVDATEFSGVSVIAANGTMTAISADGLSRRSQRSLVGRSFSDRVYFQRARSGLTYISDPVNAQSGNLIVTMSAPIRDRNGSIVGTLNGAFHVERGDLSQSISRTADPSQQVRVTADGVTVVEPTGEMTTGASSDRVNATVAATGWTVTVIGNQQALQATLWRITLLQLAVIALVLLSLLVFGIWLYRQYVYNVERLQSGLDSLGDGEYGTTIDVTGSPEWRRVADRFNELSQTLVQRRTEVAVLNRVLRHNLRNAMTVIDGNAEHLARISDDDRVQESAESIQTRTTSLLELAEHAREIESTLRTDGETSRARPIADVIDDVAATTAEVAPQALVSVASRPEPAVTVTGGDVLAVVLDELVRNSVSHSRSASPDVTIEAWADEERVHVTVRDDGPGLPPVERRLLTDGLDEQPTEHGSGLGLWTVKWLLDRMDATVDVTVDGGTAITVHAVRGPDAGDRSDSA